MNFFGCAVCATSRRLPRRLPHRTVSSPVFYSRPCLPRGPTASQSPSPLSILRAHASSSTSGIRDPPSSPASSTSTDPTSPGARGHTPPPSSTEPLSSAPRLHMVFTCAKCDTRAVKSFTKKAYQTGVVIVTCPGCEARHLIADNLGWFGEERNIEEVLAKKGHTVTTITDGNLDFSPK